MGVGQGMAAESIPGHIVKKITEEIDGGTYRTLQEWEQERRAPSGAARTLLLIAAKNPRALIEVA